MWLREPQPPRKIHVRPGHCDPSNFWEGEAICPILD